MSKANKPSTPRAAATARDVAHLNAHVNSSSDVTRSLALSDDTTLDDLLNAILGDDASERDVPALLMPTVESQVLEIRQELGLPEPVVIDVEPPLPAITVDLRRPMPAATSDAMPLIRDLIDRAQARPLRVPVQRNAAGRSVARVWTLVADGARAVSRLRDQRVISQVPVWAIAAIGGAALVLAVLLNRGDAPNPPAPVAAAPSPAAAPPPTAVDAGVQGPRDDANRPAVPLIPARTPVAPAAVAPVVPVATTGRVGARTSRTRTTAAPAGPRQSRPTPVSAQSNRAVPRDAAVIVPAVAGGAPAASETQPVVVQPTAVPTPAATAPVAAPLPETAAPHAAPAAPTTVAAPSSAAPTDAPPRRVTRPAILVSQVFPQYPATAARAGMKGDVVIDVHIDAAGLVTRAVAVEGPAALRDAAESAVRQWRYEPALEDGKPVASERRVRMTFQ